MDGGGGNILLHILHHHLGDKSSLLQKFGHQQKEKQRIWGMNNPELANSSTYGQLYLEFHVSPAYFQILSGRYQSVDNEVLDVVMLSVRVCFTCVCYE